MENTNVDVVDILIEELKAWKERNSSLANMKFSQRNMAKNYIDNMVMHVLEDAELDKSEGIGLIITMDNFSLSDESTEETDT